MHWAHSVQYSRSNSICMVNLKFIKLLFASQRPITEFVQTKSADWRTRSDKPMKMNKYRIYNRHMCIQITVQTKQNIINFNESQCALYGEKISTNIINKKNELHFMRISVRYQMRPMFFSFHHIHTNEKEINRKIINCMFWFCYPQYPNNSFCIGIQSLRW